MDASTGSPEWRGREVAARFVAGFVGGAVAVAATDQDWGVINLFGAQRLLVDRVLFVVAASVVVAVIARLWYRRLLRATAFSCVMASLLMLWAFQVPFVLLKAVLKPVNPDLWASLFGNTATTLAYAPVYGLALGVLFVLLVPVGRAWLGPIFGDPPRWAIRQLH